MFQEDNFQFWEDIYLNNDAGWDLGGVTPIFESIAQDINPGKLCIVGCGCGYDVIMFAKQGFDVTAVDFAPFPIKAVRYMAFESSLNINILQADIFSLSPKYDKKFDYVIEQTCFCAIHPEKRHDYGKIIHAVLKPGGKLIGLWFPLDKKLEDGGPPWGTSVDDVKSLFSNGWEIEREEFHELSVNSRQDREKLIIFRKTI
ncbi:MAG: methyltransferase domain-containing protein [Candidatus Neomarinimicrobiota bacterium]|jgi:SAM-dependent methyltransferase|nr:methyltransferase domain-containing protein [Candidatus Neomarinimicrobiota bacterium]|tara:strand:+ start:337 stop:939 length:603 start_codon:yes stop_codon:yes gene_type:complete